jgi:chromosome transmission fidelity protein 8
MKIDISVSDKPPERMLLELQGTVEFMSDDLTIGSLTWLGETPTLVIGHHRLTGKVVNLTRPFYVLSKKRNPLGFDIKYIVNKKLVFKNRPEHLMSDQFTNLQCFTKR